MSHRPQLLLHAQREVLEWINDHMEVRHIPAWYRAVGIVRRGRIIGGMLWYDMQPGGHDVFFAGAGKGAFLTPEVVDFMKYYSFSLLGVAHVTARTAEDNTRLIRGCQRVGFVTEGRQRKAWDGTRDAILLGLTRNH